jgi:methylated-DNA-[protein]-cysteine S-methyltransferase
VAHWKGCFDSPVGPLGLVVDDGGAVKQLHFGRLEDSDLCEDNEAVAHVSAQLDEYFDGTRTVFDLDLAPDGTAFQRAVWNGLLTIPYGQTASYGTLAERVGYAGAFRAVGAANGANPIAIIMPCHRVVGSDGRLTGFGGGIPVKAALLALEGVLPKDVAAVADRRTKVGAQGPLI